MIWAAHLTPALSKPKKNMPWSQILPLFRWSGDSGARGPQRLSLPVIKQREIIQVLPSGFFCYQNKPFRSRVHNTTLQPSTRAPLLCSCAGQERSSLPCAAGFFVLRRRPKSTNTFKVCSKTCRGAFSWRWLVCGGTCEGSGEIRSWRLGTPLWDHAGPPKPVAMSGPTSLYAICCKASKKWWTWKQQPVSSL